MTAMWMPAIARLVATWTADRDWHAPFPLKRWGLPRLAIVLVSLAIVTGVYAAAYGVASLVPWKRDDSHNSRAGHPARRRCTSLNYAP
jgi:hypothetical protein